MLLIDLIIYVLPFLSFLLFIHIPMGGVFPPLIGREREEMTHPVKVNNFFFFPRSKMLTLIISLPSLPITYFHFRHTQMVASDKLGALPFPIIYNGQRIGQLKCTGQNHVDFLFFYLYL